MYLPLPVIFCETGLVVTPFLPGDSLLFAAGAFAALGLAPVELASRALSIAAVAGDTSTTGPAASGAQGFHERTSWCLNRANLDRTHKFYARYGGKT